MRLLLLRHGVTAGNLLGRYQGRTDEPLAPEGRTQALRRRAHLPPVEALWCSPLLRCRETAQLLFPLREATVVEELRELDFGAWEGHTWAEVGDEAVYDRWLSGEGSACFPGGETLGAFHSRINRAFSLISTQCAELGIASAVIVAHSGVFSALLSQKIGGNYFSWHCPPCGGYSALLTETGALEQLRPLGEVSPW